MDDKRFKTLIEMITQNSLLQALADLANNRVPRRFRKPVSRFIVAYSEDGEEVYLALREVVSLALRTQFGKAQLASSDFRAQRDEWCSKHLKSLDYPVHKDMKEYLRKQSPPKEHAVTAEAFQQALEGRFREAATNKWPFIEVQALHLHREVQMRTSEASLAMCCNVMQAAMKDGDRVTASTKGGQGALVEIRYHLPRAEDEYRSNGKDTRKRVLRPVAVRPGQGEFKKALIARYGCRCVVTAFATAAVLEAAHISPWRGDNDNHEKNGLLLRADVHTLFDNDLLGINPMTLCAEVHPEVRKEYGALEGKLLTCPAGTYPSRDALKERYERFQARIQKPL